MSEKTTSKEANKTTPSTKTGSARPALHPYVIILLLVLVMGAGWLSIYLRAPESSSHGSESHVNDVEPEDQVIEIVATIFPIADITERIGRDRVNVITLIPAGSNPHIFEISPSQASDLSRARLFIKIGAGLDDFLDKLASSVNPEASVLTLTRKVSLIDNDPHIWLDPLTVRDIIVPAIADELCRISSEDTAYFRKNQALYEEDLVALDKEIQGEMHGLEGRSFISVHSAWRYFCARYGLQEIPVEEYPGKEPSIRWIMEITETAKRRGSRAVVTEPQFSTRMAEVISSELGLKVYKADPLGGEGVPGFDTYINLMKSNIKTFKKALEGND
jgi:zinc transport system substrate-binding protein